MSTSEPVNGSYESRSYAYLYEAARDALTRVDPNVPGSFYCWLTTMLMSAFSVEAYLNHIGAELFRLWDDETKKGTSTASKFRLICSVIRITRPEAADLLAKLNALMTFRNRVVHAGTEEGIHETVLKGGMPSSFPEVRWASNCTSGNAAQYLKYAETIIETINERSGRPGPALGYFGGFGYAAPSSPGPT